MKQKFCILLALTLLVSLVPPALAGEAGGMEKVNDYTAGQFTDVSSEDWYAENVRSAYEFGIMNGSCKDFFDAEGILTVMQAVVMSCRLHSAWHGSGDRAFSASSPWYQTYVDYANANGIPTEGSTDDSSAAITRKDFARVLGAALPDEALPVISSIEEGAIPDVPAGHPCEEAVYRLYRAGVLTGSDQAGSFQPDGNISRAEAAAIVSRLADPSLRKAITLTKAPFQPVPMDQLANRKSLQKNASDAELAQAYDAALEIVAPLAELPPEEQLAGIAAALRERFERGMDYSMTASHYNDPYGYLVLGAASCAGCTRATGLCLNMLGISYEHINENQYSHQWCRVNINGTYWICDAYGLYCGPEPAPGVHPYFS